jgi:hypothetical protein
MKKQERKKLVQSSKLKRHGGMVAWRQGSREAGKLGTGVFKS